MSSFWNIIFDVFPNIFLMEEQLSPWSQRWSFFDVTQLSANSSRNKSQVSLLFPQQLQCDYILQGFVRYPHRALKIFQDKSRLICCNFRLVISCLCLLYIDTAVVLFALWIAFCFAFNQFINQNIPNMLLP